MAGGWARDGAVQEQIDDTVADAVNAARARLASGEGAEDCEECGERVAILTSSYRTRSVLCLSPSWQEARAR